MKYGEVVNAENIVRAIFAIYFAIFLFLSVTAKNVNVNSFNVA